MESVREAGRTDLWKDSGIADEFCVESMLNPHGLRVESCGIPVTAPRESRFTSAQRLKKGANPKVVEAFGIRPALNVSTTPTTNANNSDKASKAYNAGSVNPPTACGCHTGPRETPNVREMDGGAGRDANAARPASHAPQPG